MKILFMGTPDFAKAHLEALIDSGQNVTAVISQPDKPKGRKKILTAPPVKELALQKGIDVYQPETLKNGAIEDILKKHSPDILVVVAYGKILPEYVLSYPKYGCINVHGSLLPKYRGASPVQTAIIEGESETGVTVMYMDKGMDTGDIILKETCKIEIDDDQTALFSRLEKVGCSALLKALSQIENGTAAREKQDDSKATYAHMLTAETGRIDWSKPAKAVHDLVRGTYPWPSAFAFIGGKKIKITKTETAEGEGEPGTVLSEDKTGLKVACGSGAVRILRLQAEGGKEMAASDYLRGHKIENGTKFD